MRHLYSLLIYLLYPLILIRLWWRSRKNPAYLHRIGERFGYLPDDVPIGALWIHAVSVGESQATQPLVHWLQEQWRDLPIVITTTTPTGGQRVEQLYEGKVRHLYFPYDSPVVLKRYFETLQPVAVIVMETEVWPNFLHQCKASGVPVALANARLSEKSAKGYQRFMSLTRTAFACFDAVIAQADADAKRLLACGVREAALNVCGSIKFEIKIPQSVHEQGELLRAALGSGRPVWVAASTHDNEEQVALDAHKQILKQFPDALLILVPRHPERFNEVAAQIDASELSYARRSHEQLSVSNVPVYLGDVMGELPVFYGAADVAFVGGSLTPVGGHNVLEPAALGISVVFGPYMHNFQQISDLLLDAGAALTCDAQTLASVVSNLLEDPVRRYAIGQQGLSVVEENRGAMECTRQAIHRLLEGAV